MKLNTYKCFPLLKKHLPLLTKKWKGSIKSDCGTKVSKSLFSSGKQLWCTQPLTCYSSLCYTPETTAAGQAMVNTSQSMQKPPSLQFLSLVNSFPPPLPVACLWSWVLQNLHSLNGTDFGKAKRNREKKNKMPQIFESVSLRSQPSSTARRALPQGWASSPLPRRGEEEKAPQMISSPVYEQETSWTSCQRCSQPLTLLLQASGLQHMQAQGAWSNRGAKGKAPELREQR